MTIAPTGHESYYERTDEHHYKPTPHAQGAWSPDEQHFGPVSGLLAHVLDRHVTERTGPGMALARISYDILGRIAFEECEITVETVRPGRTIELLEAVLRIGGRPVVRARAWLLASLDTTAVADSPFEPIPHPDTLAPWSMDDTWGGGYIASLDARRVPAQRKGRTTAWLSSTVDLVAGEPRSELASFFTLVDPANGIAVQQDPTAWMFPNVDLTIHLHRTPRGPWTGLDTTVTFGPAGQGVTSSVLHDIHGPVGHAEQILTVRPQPTG